MTIDFGAAGAIFVFVITLIFLYAMSRLWNTSSS